MDERFTISIVLDHGEAEGLVRETARKVVRKYLVENCAVEYPHITLFGLISLKKGCGTRDIASVIGDLGQKYDYIPYSLHGWKRLRSRGLGEVFAHKVVASPELSEFYYNLATKLSSIGNAVKWQDRHPDTRYLHVSVLLRLYYGRPSDALWESLIKDDEIAPLDLSLDALRITLRGNDHLQAFDLPRKIWLFWEETWDHKEWKKTNWAYSYWKNYNTPQ